MPAPVSSYAAQALPESSKSLRMVDFDTLAMRAVLLMLAAYATTTPFRLDVLNTVHTVAIMLAGLVLLATKTKITAFFCRIICISNY